MADVYATGKKAGQPKPNRIGGKGICVECGVASWGERCRPCMQRAAYPEHTCIGCGIKFSRKRRGVNDDRKYCSRDCAFLDTSRYHRNPDKQQPFSKVYFRACSNCSKSMVAPRADATVCSDQCYKAACSAKALAKAILAKPVNPVTCKECAVQFIPEYGKKRRKYCSVDCGVRYNARPYKAKRRAIEHGVNADTINPYVVFSKAGWICQCCGCDTPRSLRGTIHPRSPELDHVIPLCVGGSHTWGNVQLLCRSCNSSKGGSLQIGKNITDSGGISIP